MDSVKILTPLLKYLLPLFEFLGPRINVFPFANKFPLECNMIEFCMTSLPSKWMHQSYSGL